jgi:hypothetical protein
MRINANDLNGNFPNKICYIKLFLFMDCYYELYHPQSLLKVVYTELYLQ